VGRDSTTPRPFLPQADCYNNLVRRIDVSSGAVTTLAGGLGGTTSGFADGVGTAATFNQPKGVAMDAAGVLVVVVSPCERSAGDAGGGGGGERVSDE
jgi:hypothetical protein